MSLYLRAADNIAGGVPLANISITFIEASECDQLSIQVRKTNVLAMNGHFYCLADCIIFRLVGEMKVKMH